MKGPHGTPNVRNSGISYLLNELDSSKEVRELFVESINSTDRSLRLTTLQILSRRPSLPASFGPLLIEQFAAMKGARSSDGDVELTSVLNALSHVEQVDAKAVLPQILELDGPDTGQRYAAIGVIALVPAAAKPALPKLLELSGGNERYTVLTALIPLAADIPEAETYLVEQLKDNSEMVPYVVNSLASA